MYIDIAYDSYNMKIIDKPYLLQRNTFKIRIIENIFLLRVSL